jgi:hypothetical protein
VALPEKARRFDVARQKSEGVMGVHQRAVDNLSGEEKFFSAIGRFISEFSQLEYTLKYLISKKAGLRDKHFPALMSHDFSLTCTIAQTVLSESVAPGKLEDFETFINKCLSLNHDRVRVAHGLWVIANEGGVLQHVSRQKLQNCSLHFKEPTVLAGLADKAALLRFELAQIFPGRRR